MIDWFYVRNVFFLVLIAFAGLFGLTYLHELQHVAVFDKYGCSSDIYFTWMGGRAVGLCDTANDLTGLDADHQVVDNLGPLIVGGGSIFVTVVTFMIFRKRGLL